MRRVPEVGAPCLLSATIRFEFRRLEKRCFAINLIFGGRPRLQPLHACTIHLHLVFKISTLYRNLVEKLKARDGAEHAAMAHSAKKKAIAYHSLARLRAGW
jgi:hypothetical protein